ncbi:MAG: acyltransferase 3 [Bryobacterales bacterium]|nr:acyltransferase 3 [Bryobacterales bacterium]
MLRQMQVSSCETHSARRRRMDGPDLYRLGLDMRLDARSTIDRPEILHATQAPAAASQVTSGHVRSLDGLRAIAAVAIAITHFGFFKAGWMGVPIFFVLSGFLITSILLKDKDRISSASLFF